MLEHYIQKNILYQLAFADNQRFSDLKPEGIENKLFSYHLNKLLVSKLASKSKEGLYSLTPLGRRMGLRAIGHNSDFANRADSVIFLVIKHTDRGYLLYDRKTYPLISKKGFMHLDPVSNESAIGISKKTVLERFGIECDFKFQGSGFFRVKRGDELESFTNFTLLAAKDVVGQPLDYSDELADYYWDKSPDFSSHEMLPNMQLLSNAFLSGELFFIDEEIQI